MNPAIVTDQLLTSELRVSELAVDGEFECGMGILT